MNRRQYLQSALATMVGFLFSGDHKNSVESGAHWSDLFNVNDWVLAGHSHPSAHRLHALLPRQDRKIQLKLPMFAHQNILHPPTNRVFSLPQLGRQMTITDLKERRVISVLTNSQDHYFYGHGAFSPDQKYLFVSETIKPEGKAAIAVLDVNDGRLLERYHLNGRTPHDCVVDPSGNYLKILLTGGVPRWPKYENEDVADEPRYIESSSLVTMEIKSGRVVDSFSFPKSWGPFGHMAQGERFLAIGSRAALGIGSSIAVSENNGPPQYIHNPYRMDGQVLSLSLDEESKTVITTHPLAHSVSAWSLESFEFIGRTRATFPKGVVCVKPGIFLYSYNGRAQTLQLKNGSHSIVAAPFFSTSNGPHFVLDRRQA